jgi:YARHG domain
MDSYLKLIKSTPLPVILIVSGILFLLLSITGGISGKIMVEPGKQKFAAVVGILLLLVGIFFNFSGKEKEQNPGNKGPASESTPYGGAVGVPSTAPVRFRQAVPYFMTRKLTESDISGKSADELDIMRNEIYARHGRKFMRADLQRYFSRQSWYSPRYEAGNFPDGILNPIERANIRFLKYQETRLR